METYQLDALLEAVQQLSTEIVFLLIVAMAAKWLIAMTFSCDFLLIIMTFFGMRVLSQHQPLRHMGRSAGLQPLYTKRQCQRLLNTFMVGLLAEQGRLDEAGAIRGVTPDVR